MLTCLECGPATFHWCRTAWDPSAPWLPGVQIIKMKLMQSYFVLFFLSENHAQPIVVGLGIDLLMLVRSFMLVVVISLIGFYSFSRVCCQVDYLVPLGNLVVVIYVNHMEGEYFGIRN